MSTDDAAIAAAARDAGAGVIIRPDALAGDTASSEAALLHAIDHLDGEPDVESSPIGLSANWEP